MNGIESYEDAERYLLDTIDEFVSRRTSYKLDRMRALLRELGEPQRAYRTIHVGGTSGKGSTSTLIAAALQRAGLRTGLHTKPHLHSMRERARIDGVALSPQEFAATLNAMMPAIERTVATHGRPTFYETLLALAFSAFARARADVAVIEVGLGGRLDGTNVIVPVVAAITSVGYDHTEILGETIEEIAFEKAGIAKAGVPLVVAPVPPAALAVIERCAAQAGAQIVHVADVIAIEREPGSDGRRQALHVRSRRGDYRVLLPVLGVFQRTNAATAIAVLEELPEDVRPSPEAIAAGFSAVTIPGRMELISTHPAVLFDIAHNAEKAESLVASLRESFGGRRVHYVVAIGESKDAKRIVEILAALPSTFTFTSFTVAGRRAIPPARLATIAQALGTWGRAIEDPIEALAVARRGAEIGDLVVVTGSTFVVARLREWYAPAAV